MYLLKLLAIVALIGVIQGNVIPEQEEAVADLRNNHVTYRLYNRNVRGVVHTTNDDHIEQLEYGIPTIITIHAEGGSYRDDFSTSLRSRFSDMHDVNLFVMDWEYLAGDEDNIYDNMRTAAQDLIKFLLKLRQFLGDCLDHESGIHLIGFGIGAHLAGNAASPLSLFWPIARITGLDPTGGKMFGPYSCHLSQRDALYVEIIHTDGDIEDLPNPENHETDFLGIGRRIGDVDFFVNGGSHQPGCRNNLCSHKRAWQLYALSLEHNHFLGYRCTTFGQMVDNRCTGMPLLMGGPELVKVPVLPGIFRMNSQIITENFDVFDEQ